MKFSKISLGNAATVTAVFKVIKTCVFFFFLDGSLVLFPTLRDAALTPQRRGDHSVSHLIPAFLPPQYTEQFVSGLQTELEQSRLREAELLGALKEMQDKVLDLEKVRG